jgi:formate hydrogenlyase transcriptional activator
LNEHFLEQLRAEVARQTAALRASEERYRLLAGLGGLVNSSLDLSQVFRRAAGKLWKVLKCDRVSLILTPAESAVRHGFAVEFGGGSPRWVEVPRQRLAGSAAESVLTQRRPRLVRLDRDRPFPEDQTLFDKGYRSYVYLPLICHQQGVGVLGLASRDAAKAEGWDLPRLRELAGVLATAVDNAAAYARIAELKTALEEAEGRYLRSDPAVPGESRLVGTSPAMEEVRRALAQVAVTDSTVLILGETGTGKELVARAIHEQGRRRGRLLVAVNCAALASGVLASELFGHEAGAFTGATKRRLGRFELADGGSLFLDEVGELPPEVQVLLLRALQERVIERVGGGEPIAVDVRLIAATNRDLHAAMREGHFRPDLFYRLNVFPIRVPPLRERREDIPELIEHFVTRCGRKVGKTVARIDPRTLELAVAYPWPGNVRELENLVERALIVTTGDTLALDPTWLTVSAGGATAGASLAEQERRAILDALERAGGRIYGPGGAAALLGLRPTTLYGKMRKHGIRKTPSPPRIDRG